MIIDYVVFNLATGHAVKAGQCQSELLEMQIEAEGQRALETKYLTVDGNRSIIWGAARKQRDDAIDAGAPTPFGAVDSDEAARSNVSGAALGALIAKSANAPYSVTWTMLDNSTVALDADQMIAMALSVLMHVNACHERARELRAVIEAATDMAALLAIDVTAGWPVIETGN